MLQTPEECRGERLAAEFGGLGVLNVKMSRERLGMEVGRLSWRYKGARSQGGGSMSFDGLASTGVFSSPVEVGGCSKQLTGGTKGVEKERTK